MVSLIMNVQMLGICGVQQKWMQMGCILVANIKHVMKIATNFQDTIFSQKQIDL